MRAKACNTFISIRGNIEAITMVQIESENFGSLYEDDLNDIPCSPGDKIILYHNDNILWSFHNKKGTQTNIGHNKACYFVVPNDVNGNSSLYIKRTDCYTIIDDINFLLSTGWILETVPKLYHGVFYDDTTSTNESKTNNSKEITDMKTKYDTTIIRDAVSKRFKTQSQFTKLIAKKLGCTDVAVRLKICGSAKPTEREMSLYSQHLGLSLENIKKCYSKRIDNTKKSTSSKITDTKSSTVQINYNALIEAAKNAGYSLSKTCKILGIGSSTFATWKKRGAGKLQTVERMAALFSVPAESLYFKDKPASNEELINNTPAETAVMAMDVDTTPVPTPSVIPDFKEIGDIQNIHDIFEIINNNIIALGNIAKALTDMTDHLNQDHVEIYKKIMDLTAIKSQTNFSTPPYSVAIPSVEDNNQKVSSPITIAINKDRINDLVNGFCNDDSYDDYRHKINDMVSIIACNKKATHKQVLHTYYKQMNTVYGVVYDQLKKDYYAKYQRKNNGSMELLYEEPIFREVFYNIISGELQNLQTA